MNNRISSIQLDIDYSQLVRSDRVHSALYNDARIFEDEMQKIFYSTWIWVAHASEIPEGGSYKTMKIGAQPVIVVRDRQNEVHVLLNRCRHRAATVCEHKKGKVASFVCPYHGWAYALDGSLRGVPSIDGYGEDFDKSKYPLLSLRVEQYNGMIFASFKQNIQPLDEFLGAAKKWIDLFMKQGAGYPVKVLSEHRFTFAGNWKIQLENTTDSYHFPLVHKSFLRSIDDQTGEMFDFKHQSGFVEDLGNGHSVMVMIPALVDLEEELMERPIQPRFEDLAQALRDDGYDELQVRRIVRAVGGSGFNLNIFPNIACSMAFLRVMQPITVDKTEIHHAVLTMEGGPQQANQYRLRLHEHFQGPLGFGTPDDAEAWERVQRGAAVGQDSWIMLGRGLATEVKTEHGVKSDASAETGMRAAYQQWKKMMTT